MRIFALMSAAISSPLVVGCLALPPSDPSATVATTQNTSAPQSQNVRNREPAAPILPATIAPRAQNTVQEQPAPDLTPPNGMPDLRLSIGEDRDSATAKVFAQLRKGMLPEEAGKIVPGAEKVDRFGFSSVNVNDVVGVQKYRFYFAENRDAGAGKRLSAAAIHFKRSVSTPPFFEYLVKICANKLGPAKDDDVRKELVTWAGGFGVAQLHKDVSGGGYVFDAPLEK